MFVMAIILVISHPSILPFPISSHPLLSSPILSHLFPSSPIFSPSLFISLLIFICLISPQSVVLGIL